MANAIPVNSKPKKQAEKAPEVNAVEMSNDELLAKAREIVESEVPAEILDEQVNQIGQINKYGKIKAVTEIPYEAVKRDGDGNLKTVARTAIRIDH